MWSRAKAVQHGWEIKQRGGDFSQVTGRRHSRSIKSRLLGISGPNCSHSATSYSFFLSFSILFFPVQCLRAAQAAAALAVGADASPLHLALLPCCTLSFQQQHTVDHDALNLVQFINYKGAQKLSGKQRISTMRWIIKKD